MTYIFLIYDNFKILSVLAHKLIGYGLVLADKCRIKKKGLALNSHKCIVIENNSKCRLLVIDYLTESIKVIVYFVKKVILRAKISFSYAV